MNTKHTPGPWNLEYIERILRFADKNPMAAGLDDAALYIDGINEPSRDDARLIAAAPELLRALVAIRDNLAFGPDVEDPNSDRNYATGLMNAAIAKATGDQP